MGNRSLNIFVATASAADIASLRARFAIEEDPIDTDDGLMRVFFEQTGLDDGPLYSLGDAICETFPALDLVCLYHPEEANWEMTAVMEWHGGRRSHEIKVPR